MLYPEPKDKLFQDGDMGDRVESCWAVKFFFKTVTIGGTHW